MVIAAALAAASLLFTAAPASATYAEGGDGLYRGSIDWMEWGASNTPIVNGSVAETTRVIGGQTLKTTCTIDGVSGNVKAYRSGDYRGDAIDNLYNIGGAGTANQMVYGLANTDNGATVSFRFSCATTLDGRAVPLSGLVVADAESSNLRQGEYIQADPDETSASWRIIERARNCATSVNATLQSGGQLRLSPDADQCSQRADGYGPIAIGFMEGATGASVQMKGGGRTAIALGVMLDADFGDAPESYGEAGALLDRDWQGGSVPIGTTNVSDDAFTLATPGAPALRLGASVDAESSHLFSAGADGDDLDGSDDEDAVGAIGTVAVTPGEQYTLASVACTGNGVVAGWIDWNRNGVFDDGERSAPVPCAGGTSTLSWTVPLDAKSGASFVRLRIASSEAELASPIGITTSGEVEDHALTLSLPGLAIEKISDATADTRPGDTVTYTVRATNTGTTPFTTQYPAVVVDDLAGVLDDADYADDASADRAGTVSYASPLLSWTGALAVGDRVEITYSTVVKGGGDGTARNVAWAPADPKNPVTPDCADAVDGRDPVTGESCAEAVHLLPKLTVKKTALTADLPAVGGTARFRVELTNSGPGAFTAVAPAVVRDDLIEVLDDATFDAATSDVDPQPEFDGDRYLSWRGALASGQTVTIEYSVIYRGAGDHLLFNTVCVDPDDAAAGADACDTAQVPAADPSWWKEVKASSDPVVAGTTLDYTLWFANEDGLASAAIDAADHLTHVLDDADVTIEPASDTLTVTREGEIISITGEVEPGELASVTYQVTVRADGQRGDDIAANFLLDGGTPPPATPECTPQDAERPDCTVTPIRTPAPTPDPTTPPASPLATTGGALPVAALVVGILAIAVGGVFLFRRRRRDDAD